MQQNSVLEIKDTYANPAPLGLSGFGLTTVLLNIHNADLFPLDTMIVAMGIFYGGLAQIIVGIMEFKKNNSFGTTAFTSYGFFWISLVFIWLAPEVGLVGKPSAISMTFYLSIWGVFSAFLFAATFKMAPAMRWLFGSVVLLFALLAIATITGSKFIHTLAGLEGILCGSLAIYIGMAQLMNEYYGKVVMPLGVVKKA
ncbi:MAG: acetate uptake transporter [Cyclobacteriaceae bacterium]|nr:acetate uptake transporter [Cyclobacteriaceae bacterium]